MNIITRTKNFSEPATTNQLSTSVARKLPDQSTLKPAETRLATQCLLQPAELWPLQPAHTDLPFQDREQAEGTSSVADNYSLTNLAPSPTDCRRLAIYTVLSVPVAPDLQSNQLAPRNISQQSLLSTRKAQIRPHRQAELSAHLVLLGGRSQQATTRAKPKKRPRGRSKHLRLPAPANVTKSAEHANDTLRLVQARKEERGSS